MKEVEAKILEINREKTEKTLKALGAKKIFDGEIQTLFFDFQDGAIVKARNLLRLRTEEGKAELTFKEVHVTESAKVAQEFSVEVSSLETTRRILEGIGLKVTETMAKRRVSYLLDHARFDFDQYRGEYSFVPEFLEIEAEDADQIHKYAALIGFKPEDCLPWSTNDLIRHYSAGKSKT